MGGEDRACHSPLVLHSQVELAQLLGVDDGWRAGHEIQRVGGLRKGNHLANRRFTGQNRHDANQSERNAAVGWSPVLERLEEEPETQLRLLVVDAQTAE